MASINIPKRHYTIFRKLAELNDSQFAELVKALNEIKATLDPQLLSKRLSEKAKTIAKDDMGNFVDMLCGVYPAKENIGKTAAQIATDIKERLGEEKPSDFPPEKLAIIEQRMNTLLRIDKAIAVTAKAQDVVTEHQHIFCGARIFSDIRPVFSTLADSVSAAVIVHTLNISYHLGTEHKEFFVAMDQSDIGLLKKAIERAEKKAVILKSIIQKSEVPYLEEGE
jgi:hypothetical protein